MSENPILDFRSLPDYDRIRPEHVDAAMARLLEDGERAVATVAARKGRPTWRNTMAPLEALEARIADVWSQVEHMCAVMSTDEWRERHMEWSAKLAGFRDRIGQDATLYRRCGRLAQGESLARLSPVRRKILLDAMREFKLSGIGLPGKSQKEFREVSAKLAELSSLFSRNLMEATNDFALWAEDDPELGDFPADVLEAAREGARKRGGEGLRFTLLGSSYAPFMRHCRDRGLRAQMHRAYMTRASDLDASEADNRKVVAKILRLRRKQARLLGYGDYVEMALESRMAKSAKEVRRFLLDLARRARPHAEREYRDLERFAAERLGISKLRPWDVAFASEKMREHLFGYSDAEVREYFSKKRALGGLRSLLTKLFGMRLTEAEAPRWSPDVDYWQVKAANGGLIGGLFADLHARESKRPGAWMADAVCRRGKRGKLVLPVCHIVGNFAPLGPDGDCQLSADDLLTLFHESGHAVHHLLTRVDEFGASGINGVEWDAVELPSQYMENYLWRKDVMVGLSRHRKTGRRLPDDLYGRIVASRRFQAGLRLLRQVEFALFDLKLHDAASHKVEPGEILKSVRKKVSVARPAKYDRFWCGFSHIFDSGYAAGYYSYLWAEVLAADAYRHSESQLGEGGDYARAGVAFRDAVLAVGGSRPMMESFRELTGRKPDIEPLLSQHGLA